MRQIFSLLFLFIALFNFPSCEFHESKNAGGTYVKPTITRKGQFRKAYVRKKFSTHRNAVRNRNRSRYYYHTRGKYRRRR